MTTLSTNRPGPDVVSERRLNEARSALNCCRLDQVGLGQLAPGGALGTHDDRAAEPDGLHQLRDWRGVRELEIGLPPGTANHTASPVSQTDTEAPAATPIAATVHA